MQLGYRDTLDLTEIITATARGKQRRRRRTAGSDAGRASTAHPLDAGGFDFVLLHDVRDGLVRDVPTMPTIDPARPPDAPYSIASARGAGQFCVVKGPLSKAADRVIRVRRLVSLS
jgi:hypothetical protein